MNADLVKLAAGLALFATWVGLVVAQVPHTEDIIGAIKVTLTGLGAHYLTTVQPNVSSAGTRVEPPRAEPPGGGGAA